MKKKLIVIKLINPESFKPIHLSRLSTLNEYYSLTILLKRKIKMFDKETKFEIHVYTQGTSSYKLYDENLSGKNTFILEVRDCTKNIWRYFK